MERRIEGICDTFQNIFRGCRLHFLVKHLNDNATIIKTTTPGTTAITVNAEVVSLANMHMEMQ